MGHVRRRLSAIVAALIVPCALAQCTGATMMELDVSDYRTVFGTTTDQQILVSILRARDRAPLHFTELQSLGANMQLTSSLQVTDPIAKPNGSTSRASLQGTLGAQNNPTFSLATLETQGFTKGLLTPVEPTLIKQFLDEGIDARLLFLLFFSSVRLPDGTTYRNNVECEPEEQYCTQHFYQFLTEIDRQTKGKIVANVYVELTHVGHNFDASTVSVKDVAGIDFTKFRVKTRPKLGADGKQIIDDKTKAPQFEAAVFSVSPPKIAFCAERRGRLVEALSGAESSVCTEPEVFAHRHLRGRQLAVRSTYQIIEYLGQVLRFQEKRALENRCLKLDAEKPRTCDRTDVFFQVNAAQGAPMVAANYEGSRYAVSVAPCQPGVYCDHSTEVMKILTLLINANKSATDIPGVPLVRVVP